MLNIDPINGGIAGEAKSRYSLSHTLMILLAIVLLTVALRVPLLDIPFERDEGEYAYIAWRLGHNELPYLDWFDQKPPAIFWVYRLALALPFESVCSVHLVGMTFALASAIGLYFLARRLVGTPLATVAALLFVVLSVDPTVQGTAANTELFMTCPIIIANLVFLRLVQDKRSDGKLMFAVGVLCGLAMMFKQVAGANWLFLVAVFPFLLPACRRLRGTFAFVIWSAVGLIAIWAVVAAFFYSHDALYDFIYNVYTHNMQYVMSIPILERLSYLKDALILLAKSQALVWVFCLAGLVVSYQLPHKSPFVFLTGWLFAGIIGASAGGYYFPHYFQQILPPLAVLSAYGVKAFYEKSFWASAPSWVKKATCIIAIIILPCTSLYPFLFTYSPTEAVRRIYPGNSFADMPEFAKYIRAMTKENDRVFVFGAAPELLFYARRASATHYIFLFPLYGPYTDALEKQVTTAREIAAARPALVVYRPNALFFEPGTEQYFTRWIDSFLALNYERKTIITKDNHSMKLFLLKR